MSGIVKFSNGQLWKVGGAGWRDLLEHALAEVSPGPLQQAFQRALYIQGLDLTLISDEVKRVDTAHALLRSAQSLVGKYGEAGVSLALRDLLVELIWHLEHELNLEDDA